MPNHDIQRLDASKIATQPHNIDIDFSSIPEITILAREVRNCTVTGVIGSQHNFNRCNLVISRLRTINAFEADFDNVDFKDCVISDSHFQLSKFSVGAMAGCFVSHTRFQGCSYRDLSVTETEFRRVIFEDCDLSKMLIKNCRFIECAFRNCKTSNKLFEASLVINCSFENTDLELRTISTNFGITAAQLRSSSIREIQEDDALEKITKTHALNTVERFRVQYFLNPGDALTSEEFDQLLDADAWKEQASTPSHFISVFGTFSEFITYLYDQEQIPIFVIWRLHATAATLAADIGYDNAGVSSLLYKPLMGIQMDLARLVEAQVGVYEELLQVCGHEATFLVEGPLDKAYYEYELAHLFGRSSARITRLVPHNSPSEMAVLVSQASDLAPFLALLVCTRVNFQLQQLGIAVSQSPKRPAAKPPISPPDSSLAVAAPGQLSPFALSVGLTDRQRAYEIKLMTVLPGKYFLHFMIQLRLDVPVKTIARFRDLLVGVILPRE